MNTHAYEGALAKFYKIEDSNFSDPERELNVQFLKNVGFCYET